MGASGEDVVMSPLARSVFPFSIEAKNQERVNVWDAYEQAKVNAPKDADPILFIKRNRSKPMVVMDAERFLYLISKLREDQPNVSHDPNTP